MSWGGEVEVSGLLIGGYGCYYWDLSVGFMINSYCYRMGGYSWVRVGGC